MSGFFFKGADTEATPPDAIGASVNLAKGENQRILPPRQPLGIVKRGLTEAARHLLVCPPFAGAEPRASSAACCARASALVQTASHDTDCPGPMATDTSSKSPEIRRALPGHRLLIGKEAPLQLDCGATLAPAVLAYQTYGELNADKSNAILVFHALTGDQFAAEDHPVTGRPGW